MRVGLVQNLLLIFYPYYDYPILEKNPNDLRDDLVCSIAREIFTDPVVASDGSNYERDTIITWLMNKYQAPITNQHLDNTIFSSNITIQKLLINLSARTISNNFDATPPPTTEVENVSIGHASW